MGNNLIFMRRRLGIMAQPHRETKTGDLVTFTGIKAPLSILAQIVPVQSGSGDPSPENMRPITGWTGCDISNTNAILYDCTENPPAQGTINSSTGGASSNAYRIRTPFIEVKSSTKYRILTNLPYVYVHEYSANDGTGYIGNSGEWKEPPFEFTTTGTTKYVRFVLALNTGSTTRVYPADLKYLNVLEDNVSQVLSVNWTDIAGTVYGGSLQINTDGTGVLTGDTAFIETTWGYMGGATDYTYCTRKRILLSPADDKTKRADALCNVAPTKTTGVDADQTQLYIHATNNYAYVTLPKETASDTTIQIMFYLATPVIYNLTAEQVGQLMANNGVNNVWSNANGQITVNYWKH